MTVQQNITAIIFDKKGKVLSIGKNSYTKTHTKQAKLAQSVGLPDKIYLHAEVDAIIKCRKQDLDRAYRIFVFRTNSEGRYLNAKPCLICQKAIEQTNIKQIHWS
jgi:deoxycytidylate deaminase